MKMKTPVIGGICQSVQGRDKDRYYLIRQINADGSVDVVDGNFKKLAAPKKKNLKHLRLLPEKAESIAVKFENGSMVYDTEVYSALKAYNNPAQEQETESKDVQK
ncbi:MAG: KOW domain-containing RNA-binding protein [Clostridia bacterium]|nr:KOW domain-containing RNA-binding protein [Clostridia bacterium]